MLQSFGPFRQHLAPFDPLNKKILLQKEAEAERIGPVAWWRIPFSSKSE